MHSSFRTKFDLRIASKFEGIVVLNSYWWTID